MHIVHITVHICIYGINEVHIYVQLYICRERPTTTRIYPGTTQILLTINVNTRLKFRPLSTPLLMFAISLAIDVNKDTSNYSINASTRTHFTRLQCVTYKLHFQYLLMDTFSYMDNVQYSLSRFTMGPLYSLHIYIYIYINICTYNCKYNCTYIYSVHEVYLLIYLNIIVHIHTVYMSYTY